MTFEGSFKERKKVSLKVQDPDPTHVGRNIVTLDRKTKEELGITSGDLVEIQGTKKTAAVVWPARAEDEGKATIRMDNLIRHNCGVGLGEKVEVAKAEYKDAKKVVLAPTQDVRIIATGYDRVLKKTFIGRPLTKGDRVWITVFGSGFIYAVVDTNPRGIVKITDFTQFVLKEEPIKETMEAIPKIAYEDIGGLEEQVQKVREMIELPMRHPELFRRLGISPPKGVLLHGPPGTGKTLLAKAVANETNAHFISVSGPSIMSKFVGEAEERIRQIFKEAEENSPSIIFIDELDSIAPKREEAVGEVERRVVAQLLALMDGMEARGNVIVIAATNRVNALDEALRRPGRFDREIEIGVPDKNGRKAILQVHSRGMPLVKFDQLDKEIMKEMEKLEGSERIDNQTSSEKNDDERLKKIKNKLVEFAIKELQKDYSHIKIESIIRAMADSDLEKIVKAKEANLSGILSEISKQRSNEEVDINHYAQITHGFVGADLAALVKEAAMKALRRYLPEINLEEETIPPEVLEKLEVKKDDFDEALKDVQPSALREVMVEIPNIRWTDIGGLEEVKEELKQVVEWPIKFPEVFTKMGIKPPTGILLYGPPGTGKTLLAKAIANESEANFISIKGPELLSKFVGESEKGVRKIFRKARQVSPVVVFFDEIDSLATIRNGSEFDSGVGDRVANQLLTELDGVESLNGVIFIAATNRPDLIDPALLRPGRIDKIIIVGAPDEKAREEIFKVHLKGVPLAKNFNLKEILQKTKGYTGADIQGLVREAVL
ncbi:MAG: CDC48 family AAA ATPase, partial [Candidatus Diapherotrites archaeon]|nr:CDC48 family AAA ATPase [Candidatus Diapherotrites archaeon]